MSLFDTIVHPETGQKIQFQALRLYQLHHVGERYPPEGWAGSDDPAPSWVLRGWGEEDHGYTFWIVCRAGVLEAVEDRIPTADEVQYFGPPVRVVAQARDQCTIAAQYGIVL